MNASSVRKGEYVEFGSIKNAAILFDYNDSNERLIRSFIGKLYENGINSSVAAYSQIEIDTILREDFVYYRDRDFSIVGKIRDKGLVKFLESEYDILFDLRDDSNIVSDFIHRSINRKFSVGTIIGGCENDIVINTEKDIVSFTQNIIEYLRNLKKI